jgi:zinc transporter, ZIP family
MTQLFSIILISWLAGICAFLGGVFANIERSVETTAKRELIHAIVAFGGGILLAAVAFSLAPEGIEDLSPEALAATFCLGGVVFALIDDSLRKRGDHMAQFMAMLMDFLPEAIALGALFANNHEAALLLALYIGAQNLPEGFNAFRELVASNLSRKTTLTGLFLVSLLGPAAASLGYFLLREQPTLTATIMSFAGGGILYLIFQDVAPKARMRRHWAPPLGAVFGFLVGMLGKQVLG